MAADELILTKEEIFNRMIADFISIIPEVNPVLVQSFINALIVASSGRFGDLNIIQQILFREIFLNTAEFVESINNYASYKALTQNPATQATGNITATGVIGSNITVGEQLTSANAAIYTVDVTTTIADNNNIVQTLTRLGSVATGTTIGDHGYASGISVTISGAIETEYNGVFVITVIEADQFEYTGLGTPATPATGTLLAQANTASVFVRSQSFGQIANLAAGAQLTFSTPLAGVDNNAFVQFGEVAGGTDIESVQDFQERVLFAYQNPISLFNVAQIIVTARTVSGVTRVFVLEITPTEGLVTIYFTRDNDVNIIPTGQEVADVKARLLTIKPAHMANSAVIVLAPTPVSANFIISSLSPNTQTMQDAIEESLNQFFRSQTSVGADVKEFSYLSAIANTVDVQTGDLVQDFTVNSPVGDIVIGAGELAILGTVAFI